MPAIEQCAICFEEMDPIKEKYVLISKETNSQPRRIAHPKCAKEGAPPIDVEMG